MKNEIQTKSCDLNGVSTIVKVSQVLCVTDQNPVCNRPEPFACMPDFNVLWLKRTSIKWTTIITKNWEPVDNRWQRSCNKNKSGGKLFLGIPN